ncbi:hypothetical protein BX661DRAFT_172914 [Kickxella alabastrina]|uniref:uncharacterized protein n=1 Tax=Kickxella alabastrina TaxID=61397 RepID=UPI00221F3351|nr:uncharacterized protein BX661DRAFT_172914 [Kickxella alabastrina]KAI7822743.1 hypothetical protein BX661DRAFT_172914 [Kickxella alabastrina]
MKYSGILHKTHRLLHNLHQGYTLTILVTLALTASLLLTGIPPETSDHIFAQTHRHPHHAQQANNSRPITQIIVFGNAGAETNDHNRAKLCGGNLWVDHLAEALSADLVSYAHGYTIRNKTIVDSRIIASTRTERVKSPMGDGKVEPVYKQIRHIFQNPPEDTLKAVTTLFVLLANPTGELSAEDQQDEFDALAQATNELILSSTTRARRLLVIDTPMAINSSSTTTGATKGHRVFDSMYMAQQLVSDPSIEINIYDSRGFLKRMQNEYYKYGLKYPNHPCIYNQIRRCNKPDRFFWCDKDRVGNKAHFYLADDIVKKLFMASVPPA